ncbi:MAG: ribonuclease HII [Pseudomonadota bacterium]
MAGPVAGIDEAGRGPWAGPVVAAAVILDRSAVPEGLDDSKKLTEKKRAALFDEIVASAHIGLGVGSVDEIDRLNILRANDLAMIRAVKGLGAQTVLIDGNRVPPGLNCACRAIVKGDTRSLSIAAASIIAKITRDRIMHDLSREFPGYGWERNKGYGTREHRTAMQRLGITVHHRRSFKPIHDMSY